ncbi:MAG: TetR/AcrR family transcriptional regulator [Lachnospiraceae bacterium]|nr:TetR/AcrR family transcriptional regulator [Lachnospiraceae bacterium]
MGKAYTQEEKDDIRKKIWEAGLELFHAEDEKSLNIRRITEKAGISLGSFYHFYEDKESLLRDLVIYRSSQKLDVIRESFPASKQDPRGYLEKQIYFHLTDMGEKIRTKAIYRDTFREEVETERNNAALFMKLFAAFLEELQEFWKKEHVRATMEIAGILDLVRGAEAYYRAKPLMKEEHFDALLQDLIHDGICRYVKVCAAKDET